jgi:hypothetical protein
MTNVLTALQPILFSAAQQVSAEPFGVVDAIATDFNDQGVAKGDKVVVPIAPLAGNADFEPAAATPQGAGRTAEKVEVEITKSRKQSIFLTGEQIRSLDNGATSAEWVRQTVAQMMRGLRNEAEADAALAIKVGASRATGTAGTDPFATNINPMVDVRKILADNGAPMADLQMVFSTTSGANLRKLGIIQQADQAGTDAERRSGNFLRQFGFQLRESAGIALHTKGTANANYDTNLGATLQPRAREIAVDTGSGTIVAGDVITFTGDSNQYVVNTGIAAAGTLTIGRPGLRQTLADGVDVALAANYTPTLAFERSAVVGIMRPPIMPANPTITQQLISDQFGMTYLLLDIAQYGQRTWELHLAWGFKVVQGEHVALLLG